jgi:hypothetical protein
LAGVRLVIARKHTCRHGVSEAGARTIFGLLQVVSNISWRCELLGRDNSVLKIADDPPNLSAPVNPSTLPVPVPMITVLGPWQGTESFLKKNQDVAYLCD